MDENTQKIIVEKIEAVSNWIGTGVERGGEIVAEQAPLVVNEVIRWGLGSNIFLAAFFFILLSLSCWICVRFGREWHEALKSDPGAQDGWTILSALLSILSAAGSIALIPAIAYRLYMIVFILCAPRLYVIQEIAQLINVHK